MRPPSLRRNALEKLAALSAVHSSSSTTVNPDFVRLAERCASTGHAVNGTVKGQAATSMVPMVSSSRPSYICLQDRSVDDCCCRVCQSSKPSSPCVRPALLYPIARRQTSCCNSCPPIFQNRTPKLWSRLRLYGSSPLRHGRSLRRASHPQCCLSDRCTHHSERTLRG